MTVDMFARALGAFRRTASSRSATVLIAANAIPLVGVLFFGWSLLTILVLYWIENGIVGFWNVPKMLLARGSVVPAALGMPTSPSAVDPAAGPAGPWATKPSAPLTSLPGAGRIAMAAFFLVHYGGFWLVHGVFVFVLPEFGAALDTGAFGQLLWGSVAIGALALFLSHGASFLFNYLGRGEYLTSSATGQMGSPYARVVVLHLTIIFGAFLVAILGAPIGALLVLVILKTAFDLGLHLREHRGALGAMPHQAR
jgi:hypothetical protein